MRWLGLTGGTAEGIEELGLGGTAERPLRAIAEFCGIEDVSVRLLYGTELSGVPRDLRPARVREILAAAEEAVTP
ncbi:hypothetical protein [Streptomyces purpureus]|uniref:Uncharacterized protein n=2 Tax=Streptomyces purpureus TaxID=1951 RepID=A0A918HAE5_9ACTN|nr:hypothetical protein [Streptomyces purpureus]GGT48157.1 hypothetical protein GCM10014713_48050 [Streptomyces purpureus]